MCVIDYATPAATTVVSMLPQTPAATAALEVAKRYYTPALPNHRVRSYLWSEMYAVAHDITADAELLYVSAMLHDIGLTEAFDTYRTPFEVAGGDLAWVFSVAAGWPPDRAARAPEIIVLHMRDDVCATVDPESHLLQVATAWDVAGCRPEGFSPDARACRRSLSRLGFGAEFLACFQDQAKRKPQSAAATSIANDAAGRIAANPLG